MRRKLEASAACFSPCPDRFVTTGYRDPISAEEKWDVVGNIKELDGMELGSPFDSPEFVKKKMDEDVMREKPKKEGLIGKLWRRLIKK